VGLEHAEMGRMQDATDVYRLQTFLEVITPIVLVLLVLLS
jgi:hypothetical protein